MSQYTYNNTKTLRLLTLKCAFELNECRHQENLEPRKIFPVSSHQSGKSAKKDSANLISSKYLKIGPICPKFREKRRVNIFVNPQSPKDIHHLLKYCLETI